MNIKVYTLGIKKSFFIIILLFFAVAIPGVASAEIITNYGFEDWTGFNGSDSPATGYIFTSPGLAPSGWTEHINSTIVTTGGVNCNNNTAYEGLYYQHVQFSSNHVDPCLGGTSQTTNVRDSMGANYPLPTGDRDNTHYGDLMTGDTAVLRFYFRTTDDWSSDTNDVVDAGGGMKFIRWAIGNDSVGDDNNVLIKARFDDDQEFPRIGIFNRGDNKMTYGNDSINWQDGEWHAFALKSVRTDTTTFDVSIYLDDWDMISPIATKTTTVPNAGNGGYYRLSLGANWSGVSNIPNLIGMDFDKIEVWNSLPETLTNPQISSVNGTVDNSANIIINGQNFGSHEDYSNSNDFLNIAWNNFEDHLIESGGLTLSHSSYAGDWSIFNEERGKSSYSARKYAIDGNHRLSALGFNQDRTADQWYSTFYILIETGNDYDTGKYIRLWGDESRNVYVAPTGSNNSFYSNFEYIGVTPQWSSPNGLGWNKWHRVEVLIDRTTGNMSVWMDSKLQWTKNWVPSDFNGIGQPWDVGGMVYPNTALAGYRFDDVYFDYTQARIELCDNSSWSFRNHCEVQIPISWEDNSINVKVNQGTFQNGDTAYLFVIDENGEFSSGYPVLISDKAQVIRADVNQDSQINTTDAMLTLRNSLGLSMSGTAWVSSDTTGDVNCDNTSNSTDAMLLLRYSLGLDMNKTTWCKS